MVHTFCVPRRTQENYTIPPLQDTRFLCSSENSTGTPLYNTFTACCTLFVYLGEIRGIPLHNSFTACCTLFVYLGEFRGIPLYNSFTTWCTLFVYLREFRCIPLYNSSLHVVHFLCPSESLEVYHCTIPCVPRRVRVYHCTIPSLHCPHFVYLRLKELWRYFTAQYLHCMMYTLCSSEYSGGTSLYDIHFLCSSENSRGPPLNSICFLCSFKVHPVTLHWSVIISNLQWPQSNSIMSLLLLLCPYTTLIHCWKHFLARSLFCAKSSGVQASRRSRHCSRCCIVWGSWPQSHKVELMV